MASSLASGGRPRGGWLPAVVLWQLAGVAGALIAASPKASFHGFVYSLMLSLSIVNSIALIASALLVLIERGLPLRRSRPAWRLGGLLAAAAIGLAASLKGVPPLVRLVCDPGRPHDVDQAHIYVIALNLLLSAMIATGFAVLDAHRRLNADWRRKVAEIEHLKMLQAEAKLALLRSKINPHFLFNTLNTTLDLIERSPRQAEAVILHLADIYRRILGLPDSGPITLAEEMALVRDYLEIEKMRLGPRLEFRLDADAGLESILIPPLVLQIFVENAVRHGIGPRKEGGRVAVRAEEAGGRIRLSVTDDGVGMSGPHGRSGFGLSSVRERLRLAYGPEAELSIDTSAGGTTVAIGLPHGLPSRPG